MTTDNFLHYLNHFVNYVKPSENNKILLILDNHASHCSLEVINFCREHFITMLGFLPHTTYRPQPLDVSIFGPITFFIARPVKILWLIILAQLFPKLIYQRYLEKHMLKQKIYKMQLMD